LLSSANFTLSLLPIRIAHRIQALRNLPFIVVSNPHISKIYNNYLHSFSRLLPYTDKGVSTPEEEIVFTDIVAEVVQTHTNTIPTLARGFLECRKYISPQDVTAFLDEHLRARIGTRLIAEQHIALHFSTQEHGYHENEQSSYIGVIDTQLHPATVVDRCGEFVGEICELRYGVRPSLVVNDESDTTFAYVPVHLEYIITELLKNAFRATIESRRPGDRDRCHPIVITIAPAPPGPPIVAPGSSGILPQSDDSAPRIAIRIRDRGGGVSPENLPKIWSYSFTTFSPSSPSSSSYSDALSTIATGGGSSETGSTIAGLGYGLPLSRAYAQYFGGGIALQSLWGWGADVYLSLKGVGAGVVGRSI
jgi:signal transduction histidine kinase